MKRSQQSVPGVYPGAVSTDDGFHPNSHGSSTKWKNKGGRNATTDEAHRGAGQIAPRPQTSKQGLLSASSATASSQAGMARVKGAGSSPAGTSGPAGSFTPVKNNANANQHGTAMPYGGHGTPPAQRGGPAGLRAGGRNQTWPNGPLYTDAIKKGGSGRDSGPIATRMPKRRGKGAAFYGEYS